MTRRGPITVAVAVGLALAVSVALILTRGPGAKVGEPPAADAPSRTSTPSGESTGGSRPTPSRPGTVPTTPATRPPGDTLRLADRYVAAHAARRTSWQQVIDRGRPLPQVSAGCADRWRSSDKDPRLDWKSVDFLCMDSLGGDGFKPQGIAGSATAQRYSLGSRPASDQNLVLTSWYSRKRVPGLFAPNHAGESVTRLVVMDMDRRRYNIVELVKPDGRDRLRNLNSHGSGLVWAGQYLYSSSHAKLWMYNADDLLEVSGRFVLPAVAHWSVHGRGGLSSISLDRSVTPSELKGINYSREGQAYVHSFPLANNGLLQSRGARKSGGLLLKNRFGEKGRQVHSARSLRIAGTSYQGVASAGRYTFANSSGLRLRTESDQRVDATAVVKGGKVIDFIRMPGGNGESVYIDYKRRTYHSMVEHGDQFLFAIPIEQLIKTAEG